MTNFKQLVVAAVRLVPSGKVVSYGQVAAFIGSPRAARQVGGTLRSLEGEPDFPWWRVLNNAGVITIKGNVHATALLQKQLLEQEGVAVADDLTLDIEAYRYRFSIPDMGQAIR